MKTDNELRTEARKLHENEAVQVHEDAQIDRVEDGSWVQAWVWVDNDDE
ncbi:MAG: hypothetical protein GY722_20375 [bacterium]|nr:hypothetical protein [bacterium]